MPNYTDFNVALVFLLVSVCCDTAYKGSKPQDLILHSDDSSTKDYSQAGASLSNKVRPPSAGTGLKCCLTSTETVGLLGTGAQDVHLGFHTAPELCLQLVG